MQQTKGLSNIIDELHWKCVFVKRVMIAHNAMTVPFKQKQRSGAHCLTRALPAALEQKGNAASFLFQILILTKQLELQKIGKTSTKMLLVKPRSPLCEPVSPIKIVAIKRLARCRWLGSKRLVLCVDFALDLCEVLHAPRVRLRKPPLCDVLPSLYIQSVCYLLVGDRLSRAVQEDESSVAFGKDFSTPSVFNGQELVETFIIALASEPEVFGFNRDALERHRTSEHVTRNIAQHRPPENVFSSALVTIPVLCLAHSEEAPVVSGVHPVSSRELTKRKDGCVCRFQIKQPGVFYRKYGPATKNYRMIIALSKK